LEPDGITLATVLAIELAIFATTPFFVLRFFVFVVVFDLVRVFGADLDLVFVFFFAAFLAMSDSAMASRVQVTFNSHCRLSRAGARSERQDSLNIFARLLSNFPIMKRAIHAARRLPTLVCAWCKHVMRPGAPKVSHGICRACNARWFGKLRPRQLPA
jgi:hypothetical protein